MIIKKRLTIEIKSNVKSKLESKSKSVIKENRVLS